MAEKKRVGPARRARGEGLAGRAAAIRRDISRGDAPLALGKAAALARMFPSNGHSLQLLAETLALAGKRPEAEACAEAALRLLPGDPQILALLKGLRAGFGSPGGARRSGDPELGSRLRGLFERPRRAFRKAFARHDYLAAFRAGEALLNAPVPRDAWLINTFRMPLGESRRGGRPPYRRHALLLGRKALRARPWRLWKDFYTLTAALQRRPSPGEAPGRRLKAERAVLAEPRRYGWMLEAYAEERLFGATGPGLERARVLYRAGLEHFPDSLKSACRLAEIELCLGKKSSAMRLFGRALADLPPEHRRQALAWRGEMRLFTGEYRAALKDLAPAAAAREPYALCWKACALMKLGRLEEAGRAAGLALSLNPSDLEAMTICGEALRLRGKRAAALRRLDAAIRGKFPYKTGAGWARINKALLLLDSGRPAAARAAFAAAPPRYLSYAARRLSLPAAALLSPANMRRAAELLLRDARGFRREDSYLDPVWMKKERLSR